MHASVYIITQCIISLFLEFVKRLQWNAAWLCGYAATFSNPRSSQPVGHSGTVDVLLFMQFGIHRILDVSEFWIRRSSAALGAPSVFGFRKNMPTKMTLWTRVIYTSWNWGWKSLDTLGSRLNENKTINYETLMNFWRSPLFQLLFLATSLTKESPLWLV